MSSLAKYRNRALTLEEEIEYLKLEVNHVFGYGWLSLTTIEDLKITPAQLAKDNDWHFTVGSIGAGFFLDASLNLRFGERPDKKHMRQIIKEQKAKHE